MKKNERISTNVFIPEKVKDIDGNEYNTIKIGNRIWLVGNLKTTRFNDGTSIPLITDNNEWQLLESPAFCWYNNEPQNFKDQYGAIYNWYTAKKGNLCPHGWHVSTESDWTVLAKYLGGKEVAGGKLKEKGKTHWNNPNTDASNESNFTALPGGSRSGSGWFSKISQNGFWWAINQEDEYSSDFALLDYNSGSISLMFTTSISDGFCVRCVKDIQARNSNPNDNRLSVVKEIISLAQTEDMDILMQYFLPIEYFYNQNIDQSIIHDEYPSHRESLVKSCIDEFKNLTMDDLTFEDNGTRDFSEEELAEINKVDDIRNYGDVDVHIKDKSFYLYFRLIKFHDVWYFTDFDKLH